MKNYNSVGDKSFLIAIAAILALVLIVGAVFVLLPDEDSDIFGNIGGNKGDLTDKVVDKPKDPECVCEYGTEVKIKTPANCSKAGVGIKACKKCEGTIEVNIPATGEHVYTKYYETSDKTQHYSDCDECGGERSFDDHTLQSSTVAATCVVDGKSVSTCTKCSYKVETAIEALGHNVLTYTASTTDPNVHYGICVNCEMRITAAHVYGAYTTVTPATCSTEGSRTRVCQICQHPEHSSIAVLDHSWGEWTVVTPATCGAVGTQVRSCTREGCDAENTGKIPLTNDHTWSSGSCTLCGVKHNDHDYVLETTHVESTCTQEGVGTYWCSICGVSSTYGIPAKGHSWDTKEGSYWVCSDCGARSSAPELEG